MKNSKKEKTKKNVICADQCEGATPIIPTDSGSGAEGTKLHCADDATLKKGLPWKKNSCSIFAANTTSGTRAICPNESIKRPRLPRLAAKNSMIPISTRGSDMKPL